MPIFKYKISNIKSQYSIKTIRAIINFNNIEIKNRIGNITKITKIIDIMLY